ncbi:hypothetical protein SAMN02745163_00813 [Clostridium cavendishii DSM 21758]|uniref:ABC-2 type transport system permease protein n=1 Tax=Clostridium cavendishii DSM 21758 TaxID=1121302 RepID=A0A1M6EC41_9CLOT|nr:hypothetical protein [Clostridium cavendishii]SHI82878.1 hypothetical protein SAMN02745163_00813 [Clostridium cavendishii DSM 21758]
MFSMFKNTFKFSFVEKANNIIYILTRIPLIGKKVPIRYYKETNTKIVLGIIGEILNLGLEFIKKFMYILCFITFPIIFICKGNMQYKEAVFVYIFLCLNLILGTIIRSSIFLKDDKKAFNMIGLMRCNPREYYLGLVFYRRIIDFIFLMLPVIIMNTIGFKQIVILLVELTAFRLFGEAVRLEINYKFKNIDKFKIYINVISCIVFMSVAYLIPFSFRIIDVRNVVLSYIMIILAIIVGVLSTIYLLNYKHYKEISRNLIIKPSLYNRVDKTDITFSNVKLDDKGIKKEELNPDLYKDKSGYEYLNAILFKRHKRILLNPMYIRLGIIGVLFFVGLICVVIFKDKMIKFDEALEASSGIMVMIMYGMSTGDRFCKAMFYNCDVGLLRYAYYRDPKVILSNFTIRLKRLLFLNVIPAVVLCMALSILVILTSNLNMIVSLIPLFLSIVTLACFFATYHLFMYYVVQPYALDLTVKSPVFKVVSFIIYIVSYICMKLKATTIYFTIAVILITIIFSVVSTILVYKLAPKTFKLK